MFTGFRAALAALAVCAAPAAALASQTQCPQFFAGGQAPDVVNPKLAQDTVPLCYSAFGLLYSGIAFDPLYSADVLTREHVEQGRGIGRNGQFHAEERLLPEMQVPPSAFRNSGGSFWDRGHMVPNSDMWTSDLQAETFSMANMVPQSADNNEVLHEGVEAATREFADREGSLYVVTGPIFGARIDRLNGRSFIPAQIFKAIYDPARNEAAAYVENNQPGTQYAVVSIARLIQLTGIDVFPSLPASVKTQAMQLPEPHPGSRNRASRESKALGMSYEPPTEVSYEALTAALGKPTAEAAPAASGVSRAVVHEAGYRTLAVLRYLMH